MKNKVKQIVSVMMIFVLIISSGVCTIIANANQSRYYNFTVPSGLSSDPATAIAQVALAQVGKSGSQLGYSEGWCDNFVSDCAIIVNQASAIPQGGAVSDFYNKLINAGATQVSTPQIGDIVIYKYSSSTLDHAGLFIDNSGNTVQGNLNGGYVVKTPYTYVLNYVGVIFLRPKYSGSSSATKTLTVYFNANGGSVEDPSDFWLNNNIIYKLSDLSPRTQIWTYNEPKSSTGLVNASSFTLYRTGYTFSGWGTSPSGGKVFDEDDTSLRPSDICPSVANGSTSITLYAQWTPNSYYLDLNGKLDDTLRNGIGGYGTADVYINGNLVANDVDDYYERLPYGSTYEIKDIKPSAGKSYDGVIGNLKGTIGSEDIVVRLIFSTKTYSLSFDPNSGTIGNVGSFNAKYGDTFEIKNTTCTKLGYTFSGWNIYRDDGKWAAESGGWFTESELASKKLTKQVVRNGRTMTLDFSWLTNISGNCKDFKFVATWTVNKLTVNYYSNYADKSFSGAANTVSSSKNVIVRTATYKYDEAFNGGLHDYSDPGDSTYLGRENYKGSGYWNTKPDGSGIRVNQSTGFKNGQELAKAFGLDLTSKYETVLNLYPEWVCNHSKSKIQSVKNSTCTEAGAVTYKCNICGSVYNEPVPATGHTDKNNDGYCDTCKAELTPHTPTNPTPNNPTDNSTCDCKCHSKGFSLFIWKIGNFFHKIFKMNQYKTCACNNPHW